MRGTFKIPVCNECYISPKSIFRHLNEEQLARLTYEKGCSSYKKGSVIYKEGNRMNGFYCVNKGIIKMFKTGFEGREQIIRFAKKGELIGYRSVLSGEFACHTAKVIDDAILCFIPSETVFGLIRSNAEFAIDMIQLTCKELNEANSFITDIAQKTVRERLAEVILILKDNFGPDADNVVQISLTREELANIVGTATESVIRLLSEFKDDKLIELNGRKIKILNEKALMKIANVFD
jgi:CRP/FNR family transcriptional regulator, polysaccharide utilization system transcription regulator